MIVVVEADQASFDRVARALEDEGDGREFRQDLAHNLHEAIAPSHAVQVGRLMAMSTGGLPHAGEPLRAAVAAAVAVEATVTARTGGASIVARKTQRVRKFAQAPRRLNRRDWHHLTFGHEPTVVQVGAPGWFDEPLQVAYPRFESAAREALQDVAHRIARKA